MAMFDGHPVNCGGTVSVAGELQHNAPPFLLSAATTVKLPYTFPTNTDPQFEGIVALGEPFTVIDILGPTNLSFDMEPTNENVVLGFTV
jgi:hypothetical protein